MRNMIFVTLLSTMALFFLNAIPANADELNTVETAAKMDNATLNLDDNSADSFFPGYFPHYYGYEARYNYPFYSYPYYYGTYYYGSYYPNYYRYYYSDDFYRHYYPFTFGQRAMDLDAMTTPRR